MLIVSWCVGQSVGICLTWVIVLLDAQNMNTISIVVVLVVLVLVVGSAAVVLHGWIVFQYLNE